METIWKTFSIVFLTQAFIIAPTWCNACMDSTSYRIITINSGIEVYRKCSWLTQNASKAAFRKAKFCGQFNNGEFVDDGCPFSCDNCSPATPAPTAQPTKSASPSSVASSPPTGTPTSSPKPTAVASPRPTWVTMKPSDSPTKSTKPSIKPTAQPSSIPTSKPTVKPSPMPTTASPTVSHQPSGAPTPCTGDNPNYRFYTYSRGSRRIRRCTWLTARADKEERRVQKFCWGSTRSNCRLSCGVCN